MVNSEFRPTQEGLACIFGRSRELLGMSLLVVPCMLQGNLHVKFGITFITCILMEYINNHVRKFIPDKSYCDI